jgi:hypothetical protein
MIRVVHSTFAPGNGRAAAADGVAPCGRLSSVTDALDDLR